MSDRMTPIPFGQMLTWILKEKKERGSVFGVYRPFKADEVCNRNIFGRKLETPIGPAAGPHTQLAQNIVASYYAGSRFFELKTVQILDGEDLPVAKPCIIADDECYNCEWSTELYVPQAQEEYIKGWFLLAVLAKEFGLGEMDGFQFNMSVGYDLEGIKSEKINTFIDSMMDAKNTKTFQMCQQYLREHIDDFEVLKIEDVEHISPNICNSVTLSTLHGCPPQEIERIATYLIEEKGLNTFIKCNPTLLGYDYARNLMDEMGYDYVAFGDFHFKDDLQYQDAVPMIQRLMQLSEEKGLQFGVKITNTFPVDVKQQELPSEEMYMSGKALYPLSLSVAQRLASDFNGKLRISYSGGADAFNIEGIMEAGIWPITVATTLLKPGGYQRLEQLAEITKALDITFNKVDDKKVMALVEESKKNEYHVKSTKIRPSRKIKKPVPLTDCFISPCKEGCPIHQDITAYLALVEEGKMEEALQVITEKNPLPFITGTICAHNCMNQCTRNFYEKPVKIRDAKLMAAVGGYEQFMNHLKPELPVNGKKIAVVGGGPAGMAATFFLSRAGFEVELLEAKNRLGGVVRHVIPKFRIGKDAIDQDARLVTAYGAQIKYNTKVEHIKTLKEKYDAVVVAVGAPVPGVLSLEGGKVENAVSFLEQFKKCDGVLELGANVVVIGGGNTAMDTARATKRVKGVEHVYLVYRRTKRYMPADEEELVMALEDGVEFKELLAPKKLEDGQLICDVMKLGEVDESGRRGVKSSGETIAIPADTIIAAVGEKVPTEFYESNGIPVNGRGLPKVNPETLETAIPGVYIIGDGLFGPATVVEGIRDAKLAANAIAGQDLFEDYQEVTKPERIYQKRGLLMEPIEENTETKRCLSCSTICENCAEVCPNRANVVIHVPGRKMHQIVHIDSMCNECGNCKSFCPYESAPYLDKFTLFATQEDMEDSKNDGFVVLDSDLKTYKVRYLGVQTDQLPVEIMELIEATIVFLQL